MRVYFLKLLKHVVGTCAILFVLPGLSHAEVTIEGVARTASAYSGISTICPEFFKIDQQAVRKYWQVVFETGVSLVGGQKFGETLKAEMSRRQQEIEITGHAQWCQVQKANQEKYGSKDIFVGPRSTVPESADTHRRTARCMAQFKKLNLEAQARTRSWRASMDGNATVQEVCITYKSFAEAQSRLIKYADANAAECGMSPGGVTDLKRTMARGAELSSKICGSSPQQSAAPESSGNTEQVIQGKCKNDWPDDFRMQAFCQKQQRSAVVTLSMGKPQDVQLDQFMTVRRKCAGEWVTDFRMRAYCEKQQFNAIRELKN